MPESPRAEPGLLGNIWAVIGIVAGFVLLVVPGVYAIRSYRRWQAGKAARPTFAWVCAWVGVPLVVGAVVVLQTIEEAALCPYCGPVVADDFADPTSGWPVRSSAASSVGYVDGEYAIVLTEASIDESGFIWSEGRLPWVSVEVSGHLVEGSGPESSIGIACLDDEANEGYLFAISDIGYAILRWTPDGVEDLASGPLNAHITRTHRIRGVCRAGAGQPARLTMVLDGRLLAEVSVPEGTGVTEFTSLMLVAGTDGDDPIEARFDDATAHHATPS